MKLNKSPNGETIKNYTVRQGGLYDLDWIKPKDLDTVNGVALSDKRNKVKSEFIDRSSISYEPKLEGPTELVINQNYSWKITNFNSTATYNPSSQYGIINLSHDVLTFKPLTLGIVNFIVAGRNFSLKVHKPHIAKPILEKINDFITKPYALVRSSSFLPLFVEDEHFYTDWQVSLYSDFSVLFLDLNQSLDSLTELTIDNLEPRKTYYIRNRHKGKTTPEISEWSDPIALKTSLISKVDKPVILSPTNLDSNVALRPVFSSSGFKVSDWTDTHISSDWQLSLDSSFGQIVYSSYNDRAHTTTWTVGRLEVGKSYFIRVRHYGASLGSSEWSDTAAFKTVNLMIEKPLVFEPKNSQINIPLNIVAETSDFISIGSLRHVATDWEIATDVNFTSVIRRSFNDEVNKTKWPLERLPYNTNLYLRVRYLSVDGIFSHWSNTVAFKTTPLLIEKPHFIQPYKNQSNFILGSAVLLSPFDSNGYETHQSTDIEIYRDISLTQLVQRVTLTGQQLYNWTPTSLQRNTQYCIRARFNATNNQSSQWSETIRFNVL